ncbi:MAG: tetratricopeptide repeat protein [Treponema sp.]
MKKRILLFVTFILITMGLHSAPTAISSYERAYSLQQVGQYYSAIEIYQVILKENKSYNLVFARLAECFYALDEFDQASDCVEKALSYKQADVELEALKGFILIGLDKVDEAKAVFSSILNRQPNDVNAKFGLAEIEISQGRISMARDIYKEVLLMRPENKRALLAMSVIEHQSNNKKEANKYIKKALKYHGNDEVTSYFAAYINALDGKYETAEAYLDTALKINADYDDALSLLASVLYESERYFEVIRATDRQIAKNKKAHVAWYIKTLALLKLGRQDEAMQTAKITLALMPTSEIYRMLLEEIAIDSLDFEDKFRKELSKYHSEKAEGFNNKNETEKAFFEYRRALKMYPYDLKSREAYAKLLLRKGYMQRYFDELQFIKSIGNTPVRISDAIESYGKILDSSLLKKWNVDDLYLDKNHISIGLFFSKDGSNTLLPETGRLVTNAINDVFSYNRRFKINVYTETPTSYIDAFKMAREKGDAYFALIKVNESNNDLTLTMELYISRTGSLAKTFNVYRSDNDRYSLSIRRLSTLVASSMPILGVILERWQHNVLVDIGKNDFVSDGAEKGRFEIVDKNKLKANKDELSIVYDDEAILGYFNITKMEEDVSEGEIKERGFYDKINKGDYVVMKKTEEKEEVDLALKPKGMSYLLYLIKKIR